MKKDTFVQGITILEETFNKTINRIIAWELLGNKSDDSFLGGVRVMVRDLKTLFPNDNLIAMIPEYINKYIMESIRESGEKNRKRISHQEPCCPPPIEWEELKNKIGRKV